MVKTDRAGSQAQNRAAMALQVKFKQGFTLHQQGKLADAERIYGEVLQKQPNHFDALQLLGVIALQTRRLERAVELIQKAIGVNAKVAAAHSNLGFALKELKRPGDALVSYDKAIALKPDLAEAHYNRGGALQELNRSADALESYDKAIALKANYAQAYNNRGNTLMDLKRSADALASYDKAIALRSNFAEAYNNRGNALRALKRPADALASYDKAIALKPDYAHAYNNRGNTLTDLNRELDALASYDSAIALKPDFAEAHNNRGGALQYLNRSAEALASYDTAIALKPDFAEAYSNRGRALRALKRPADALASYDKAIALKPDLAEAEGPRLLTKTHLCDWSNFDAECRHLILSVRNENVVTQPFTFLNISSSPSDQLQFAKLWITHKYPPFERPIWQGDRFDHDRVRVSYLSANFHEHPVSLLAVGMFEYHDKSRFDVTAISLGPDNNSEMRQRLKASFERFINANRYSDEQIANLIRSMEVDILVDLMGFTEGGRTSICARRPAPIQVNYLGYPGTMGAQYIDYIIADHTVISENQHAFYSEKVVSLPNSYQPNDRQRQNADKMFTRAEMGLPLEGFVFCCFNNNYKILPDIFDVWIRILKQVVGSVLWLSRSNATASTNLRNEAVARGVSAERLIFARRMPLLSEHLARYKCADLFIDTLPYNAHTTASDALWAGLPVVTCLGETFAGRVAASLLKAVNLPGLITTTLEDYERLAIELATNPEKLARIRRMLSENRLTTPLFNTKMYTKHIEAAYNEMYERHQSGLAPDRIIIQN
jgi:predicted O-linked N-acetylglucosamine transferase (SPINDLY family)